MATTRQRRAGDRMLGTWDGRFRSRRGSAWVDCTIVDLSAGGAGILLPPARSLLDDVVDVDVRTVMGRRRSLVFRAAVRGRQALPGGWQRIALQFTDAPGRRRRALERLLDRWR